MIFIAVVPGSCVSIINEKTHSFHYLKDDFKIEMFKRYKYMKAEVVIIERGDHFTIGRWVGIFDAMRWETSIIQSDVWMKYFGLFPDDPELMLDHWINVARFRYPLMPIKPDNYEAILAACYLYDKEKNESIGAFA